ncbi:MULTISPECIES: GTP-binding protein [unclassified Actinomyces]|uniref:sulfate adenylyltransferase subunit 1 n=1 Tax=unclassified Actinomyces TaxID=2609248 RepID=UPI0013A6D74E|nr:MULTISPECIES: GTP-binding protein [unclassified Actinomyces]MBW3069359.1 sulfate adenylyltransferase [Actinomyces sp. 594]NDR53762.1 sulfate adenylyltransferase [Actinomyces sp. 565]
MTDTPSEHAPTAADQTTPRPSKTTGLLRLATAGSVDDGKSTLVGRLLVDSKSVLRDQLAAVEQVSLDRGLTHADLALLTDGLRAEREQGITIDVAYRYFATPRRSFILADCPGHVQYTRNTVTGSSTADVVVLLVDARHGVVEQTRRHLAVAALLNVPHVVVAVNKIDLVDFSADVYDAIVAELGAAGAELGVTDLRALPTCALEGDNVVRRSSRTPFYRGPALLELLETIPADTTPTDGAFRLPVQLVIRPQGAAAEGLSDYRGYAGRIAAGSVRVGEEIVVLPSRRRSRVAAIDLANTALAEAHAGQSVTLRLDNDIDITRGDLLAAATDPPQLRRDLAARVAWLSERPARSGDRVLLKHGTRTVQAIITAVEGVLDLDDLTAAPAQALALNDIGSVRLRLSEPLPVADYAHSRSDGAFLLVDPFDGWTLAAGMVRLEDERAFAPLAA